MSTPDLALEDTSLSASHSEITETEDEVNNRVVPQSRLPIELIANIIDHVSHPETLANCARVSRSIHPFATKKLYTCIRLSHPDSIVDFVAQVPYEKKQLVKKLHLTFIPRLFDTQYGAGDLPELDQASSELDSMSNLEHFWFTSFESPPAEYPDPTYYTVHTREHWRMSRLVERWLPRLVPIPGPRYLTIDRKASATTLNTNHHATARSLGCDVSLTMAWILAITQWTAVVRVSLYQLCIAIPSSTPSILSLRALAKCSKLAFIHIRPHDRDGFTSEQLHYVVQELASQHSRPVTAPKRVEVLWTTNLVDADIAVIRRSFTSPQQAIGDRPPNDGQGEREGQSGTQWSSTILSVEKLASLMLDAHARRAWTSLMISQPVSVPIGQRS
ncbi:hypothetical protein IAT40_003372 [Kwoniella sp. CBS 6097]